MAESPQTSPRLDELRQRWEENPGSRVFLQLSEEYRRLDRTAEAASTLEQGLARRPTDVGAMVALGRCRLELDAPDGAVEVLERVLQIDPAHLVANKHLVEAHLRRGDAARASDRLGFYRLLNDRDPELDHFAYRLSRLEQEGGEVTAVTAASDDPSTGTRDLADEARSADLAATEADDNGGGVFRQSAEPFGVLPPLDRVTSDAVLDDGPFDLLALLSPPAEEEGAAVDDAVEAADEREIAAPSEPAPEHASADDAAATEPETATDDSGDEASRVVPATVALAAIYEEQGYQQDAVRVLERVLEQDPENHEARERLTSLNAAAPAAVEESTEPSGSQALTDAPQVDEPIDEAPIEAAPIDEAPIEAAPIEAAPIDEAPIEAAPIEAAPIDEAPIDEAPIEAAPIEAAPIDEALADEAPARGAPDVEAADDHASVGERVAGPSGDDRPIGVTARKIAVLEKYLATIRAGRDKLEGDHVH